MFKKLDKKEGGFTIVEVMIVLAIAGLVLAIVFIAVPALRRNSNNTGRTADVGQIATGISNYSANRGGKLPPSLASVTHVDGSEMKFSYYEFGWESSTLPNTPTATAVNVASATGTPAEDEHKLTYFGKASGNDRSLADSSLTNQALPSPDEVHVWAGYRCLSAAGTAGNPAADIAPASAAKYGNTVIEKAANRDVAIVYQLEGQAEATCLGEL